MERQFKVLRVRRTASPIILKAEEAEELAKVNAEIVEASWDAEDEIFAAAKDADAMLSAQAPVTRQVIEASPKCKVIVSYGVGFDAIDVEAATDNGIPVVNIPTFCTEEVANQAIALLLACAKKLVLLNNNTKEGRWAEAKQAMAPMGSIYGQTLGLIGCGNIGGITARKAQCFGLRVLGNDPYIDECQATWNRITLVSLPELLKESDFVSIHTPPKPGNPASNGGKGIQTDETNRLFYQYRSRFGS